MLKRSNIYLTTFAMKRKHIVYKQQNSMRKFSFEGLGGLVQNLWNELYFNMMWRLVQSYLTTSAILNYCSLTGTDAIPSSGKRCWIAGGIWTQSDVCNIQIRYQSTRSSSHRDHYCVFKPFVSIHMCIYESTHDDLLLKKVKSLKMPIHFGEGILPRSQCVSIFPELSKQKGHCSSFDLAHTISPRLI